MKTWQRVISPKMVSENNDKQFPKFIFRYRVAKSCNTFQA